MEGIKNIKSKWRSLRKKHPKRVYRRKGKELEELKIKFYVKFTMMQKIPLPLLVQKTYIDRQNLCQMVSLGRMLTNGFQNSLHIHYTSLFGIISLGEKTIVLAIDEIPVQKLYFILRRKISLKKRLFL